jgi:hypothetical protein
MAGFEDFGMFDLEWGASPPFGAVQALVTAALQDDAESLACFT